MSKITFVFKGGPGSGHHGHEGRPGKQGGSVPGDGVRGSGYTDMKLTPSIKKKIYNAMLVAGESQMAGELSGYLHYPMQDTFIGMAGSDYAYGHYQEEVGQDYDPSTDPAGAGWGMTFVYDNTTGKVDEKLSRTHMNDETTVDINKFYDNPDNAGKYLVSQINGEHVIVWKPSDERNMSAQSYHDYERQFSKWTNSRAPVIDIADVRSSLRRYEDELATFRAGKIPKPYRQDMHPDVVQQTIRHIQEFIDRDKALLEKHTR